MTGEQLLFYFFAALVLGSAFLVVAMRNLVRSMFLFFVTLFAVAGLYVFSLADFIAVTQLIIYAGGVLVLMLFAFMLSNKELLSSLEPGKKIRYFNTGNLPALVIVLTLFFVLTSVTLSNGSGIFAWMANGTALSATDNTTPIIGVQIMTRYLLPFEVVSIFLMMALVGAAHLARKEKKA